MGERFRNDTCTYYMNDAIELGPHTTHPTSVQKKMYTKYSSESYWTFYEPYSFTYILELLISNNRHSIMFICIILI